MPQAHKPTTMYVSLKDTNFLFDVRLSMYANLGRAIGGSQEKSALDALCEFDAAHPEILAAIEREKTTDWLDRYYQS